MPRLDGNVGAPLADRLRLLVGFGHTGERWSLAGQSTAGIASAGGMLLVWTVVAITWWRFRSW